MKRAVWFLAVVLITAIVVILSKQGKVNVVKTKDKVIPTLVKITSKQSSTSLFVPYWSLEGNDIEAEQYDRLLYFGIAPTINGINTRDSGFLNLSKFVNQVEGTQKTILVLRMLNSDVTYPILENSVKQKKIIDDTIDLANKNGFSGIVLDLELSALPFDSLIKQINYFVDNFSTNSKKENLTFGITVYGDTFYRIRPFDIKSLAKSTDEILIMAYDFHKAGGNPGPNFPLSGGEKYGYDYSLLVNNFLDAVPAEKINIVFGLFGYDWQVDDKGIAQKTGEPLSYLQIRKTIVDNCLLLKCNINRDPLSTETNITYTYKDGKKHIVWYEDMESVSTKQKFLKSKGITNFSFWAYSYF
jgi:spore germination protein YaaH